MKKTFDVSNQFVHYKNVTSELQIGVVNDNTKFWASIIMPVYKHPDFFEKALRSVINQEFTAMPYEIVVVDDDPDGEVTDNKKVVERNPSSKVKYYKNKTNLGLCGNWNRAIELAKGEYVIFCHDDEMFSPNALSILYELSKKTNGKAAIFPNKDAIFEDGSIRKYRSEEKLFGIFPRREMCKVSLPYFIDRTLGNGCGALMNRECLLSLGGYDPQYYPCSDYVIDILYTFYYGAYRTNHAYVMSRQGENLSFQCYEQFSPRMAEIRRKMISHISGYKPLFRLIINATERVDKIRFRKAFGPDNISMREAAFIDRLISKLYTYYIDLKKYKL